MLPLRKGHTRTILCFCVLALSLAVLGGCSFNLFSIFNPGGKSYKGLVAEADAAYQAGDYQTAVEKYGRAVEANDQGSRARVGYVTAYSRLVFIDFLQVAGMMGSTNFNPFMMLNDPPIMNGVTGASGLFQVAIDYLTPVADNRCDGEVSYNDTGVNLELSISYLLRGIFKLGDSNNDGIIGGPGDIMILDSMLRPTLNPAALNFGSVSSNLSRASTPSNGVSAAGTGSPSDVFSAITGNFASLTNMRVTNDYRYFLEAQHDSIESTLRIVRSIRIDFGYFDKAMFYLDRIATRYDNFPITVVTNYLAKARKGYAEIVMYSAIIENPVGSTFNNMHFEITGVDAYSGSVASFVPSPFSVHLASPGGLMTPLSPAWSAVWSQPISLTNIATLSNVLKTSLANFTNIDMSTLLKKWTGGLIPQ